MRGVRPVKVQNCAATFFKHCKILPFSNVSGDKKSFLNNFLFEKKLLLNCTYRNNSTRRKFWILTVNFLSVIWVLIVWIRIRILNTDTQRCWIRIHRFITCSRGLDLLFVDFCQNKVFLFCFKLYFLLLLILSLETYRYLV